MEAWFFPIDFGCFIEKLLSVQNWNTMNVTVIKNGAGHKSLSVIMASKNATSKLLKTNNNVWHTNH